MEKTSFTFKLTDEQRESVTALLKAGNYRPCTVPYTTIAVEAVSWNCNVNLYTSGKLLVQGRGAREFVLNILEPMVLGVASLGYEEVLNPESVSPHLGTDESGKGDFFGPMVIAAAYTNETLSHQMQKLGVKDSKLITSDQQALKLGAEIRKLLGENRYTIVRIGNTTYNRLYATMKSVNRLLSWGHARCIENLLTLVPGCPRAVSDQFASSKDAIERALMKKGRSIELVQMHKAESDIAVAAASILARESFLRSLQQMASLYGQTFPKGASPQVQEAAVELIKKKGPRILMEVAKCHFRTTDAVLGATGHSRTELPAEGQVVSQATEGRSFKKHATL